jgi:hypothetical protein
MHNGSMLAETARMPAVACRVRCAIIRIPLGQLLADTLLRTAGYKDNAGTAGVRSETIYSRQRDPEAILADLAAGVHATRLDGQRDALAAVPSHPPAQRRARLRIRIAGRFERATAARERWGVATSNSIGQVHGSK